MKTGEKMRKNLSDVMAAMTTNIKDKADNTMTRAL